MSHSTQRPTQHSKLNIENSQRVIRASEIGQYRYCARAWWLSSVLSVPSTNTRDLQRGETAHQRHGRAVWLSQTMMIVAVVLIALAVVVLLMAVLP